MHRLLGKVESTTARGFHVTKCQITGRVQIQYKSKSFLISLFGFIIFLYHVFDSLKRRLRLISHFSLRVSSTDKLSDLVTFFHSFLTTGYNYLMRVPAYPGLTPPHAFLSPYMCSNISAQIFTCFFFPFTVSHGLTVCRVQQVTDGHSALFLLDKVKLSLKIKSTFLV